MVRGGCGTEVSSEKLYYFLFWILVILCENSLSCALMMHVLYLFSTAA